MKFASLLSGAALLLGMLDPSGMERDFHDGFNRTELRGVWETRGTEYNYDPAFGALMTHSKGSDLAPRVRDGVLRLRVIQDALPNYYLHSHLGTEDTYTFRYGYAEARMRFHTTRGAHAAFWLLAPGPEYKPEIDVAEYFAGRGVHHNIYWGGLGDVVGERLKTRGVQPGRWHRYGVRWTPTHVRFYIDRQLVHVVEFRDKTRKFLVLSQQVKDFDLVYLNPANLAALTVDVDYVTVWRKP